MTREEHRKACIETGVTAMRAYAAICFQFSFEEAFTAAFDSLRDIAYVDPVEPTAEMLHAARNYFADGMAAYEAIAAAGDLTNWKEGKP